MNHGDRRGNASAQCTGTWPAGTDDLGDLDVAPPDDVRGGLLPDTPVPVFYPGQIMGCRGMPYGFCGAAADNDGVLL